jgi:hypothetical protein
MVVLMVRAVWPQLARIGPLHTLAPADVSAVALAKADEDRMIGA